MIVGCLRTGRSLFGLGWIGIRGRFGSDLVTGLFGWLGIGFGDSWFTGFVQGAEWSGYSWVMWLVMDYRVCIRCEAVGV